MGTSMENETIKGSNHPLAANRSYLAFTFVKIFFLPFVSVLCTIKDSENENKFCARQTSCVITEKTSTEENERQVVGTSQKGESRIVICISS